MNDEAVVGIGYVGRLWRAVGSSRANLLWIGGAAGGYPDSPASALASAGITTLDVAYFGAADLSPVLQDIPVEVGVDASRDLVRLSDLRRSPIVVGVSRGSELALLLAAHYPDEVSAVVGIVPSGRVHGLRGSTAADLRYPWRVRGDAVPLLSDIPLDRFPGPILLLSAEDDQVMTSPALSDRVLQGRASSGHVLDEHVCYPAAGHTFFGPPGRDVDDPADARHPTTGERLIFGGSRSGNAIAREQAWNKLLDFVGSVASQADTG